MRIQNNITALNTHRQYNIANNAVASSAEKLSSGYRINRAGDDAAGLAISEKMRAQIRGLNMASKNSQDAISLVQTAEGALQSTHNILQRMRELAVQSASDTNEQVIDRGALQQEFAQLKAEIDDTSAKTRFNDQNLIDGTFQKYKMSLNATDTDFASNGTMSILVDRAEGGEHTVTVTVNEAKPAEVVDGQEVGFVAADSTFDDAVAGVAAANNLAQATATFVGAKTSAHNGNIYTLQTSGAKASAMTFQLVDSLGNVVSQIQNVDGTAWNSDKLALNFQGVGTLTITRNGASTISDTAAGAAAFNVYNGTTLNLNTAGVTQSVNPAVAGTIELDIDGDKVILGKGDTSANFRTVGVQLSFTAINDTDLTTAGGALKFDGSIISVNQTSGKTLVIQSGANQGDELDINVDAMNTRMLGVAFADISTRKSASKAITEVNDAINQVSTQRAALGALQNRLGYKIANLDTSAENLQAAESRIRDVDMAKEMTEFTKKNILVQAATAMLAQANSAPQNVLSLLR